MPRLELVISTFPLAAGIAAGIASPGAVTEKFEGLFGGFSPRKGEFVSHGPGHAVYQGKGHFALHFAMRVKATGSFGNEYLLAVTGRAVRCADAHLPGRRHRSRHAGAARGRWHGSAPNYQTLFTSRIFVFDGAPVARRLRHRTQTCLG